MYVYRPWIEGGVLAVQSGRSTGAQTMGQEPQPGETAQSGLGSRLSTANICRRELTSPGWWCDQNNQLKNRHVAKSAQSFGP